MKLSLRWYLTNYSEGLHTYYYILSKCPTQVSVDLIYGLPVLTYLEIAKASISLYALNIVHNLVSDSDLRVPKNQRRKVQREVNLAEGRRNQSWWRVFLVARWL